MQIKIFINDKLYKTVTVEGTKYNPADYWPQMQADRDAGLLNSYNIQNGMSVRIEPVKE